MTNGQAARAALNRFGLGRAGGWHIWLFLFLIPATLPLRLSAVSGEEASVLLLAYAEKTGDAGRAGKLAALFLQQGVAPDQELVQEVHRRLSAGEWKGVLPGVQAQLASFGLAPLPVPSGIESGDLFMARFCPPPAAAVPLVAAVARNQELRNLFPDNAVVMRSEKELLLGFLQRVKASELDKAVAEAGKLQEAFPGRPDFQTLAARVTAMAAAEEKRRELEQQGNEIVAKYRALQRDFDKANSGKTFYDQRKAVRLTKTQQEELAREKAFLETNLDRGRELLAQASAMPSVADQVRELRVELGLVPRSPAPKKGIVR